jgi:HK97 family phage portal protein
VSLFFKPAPERRDISMSDWIRGLDGGTKTKSGETVTPANSMKLGAVWASVNLLASVVSNFPVDVFRGSGTDKRTVTPQPPFVATPSLLVSRRDWVYQAMTSLLLRGNAYGYVVERDSLQRPRVVEWLNPDSVKAEQKSAFSHPTYSVGGVDIPRDKIIHMRAFVQAGSAIGLSPIEWNAEQLGLGLAAQKYGAQWFGEGAHPTAIFQNTAQTLDPTQTSTIKDRFIEILRGRREPIVLGSDWDGLGLQGDPGLCCGGAVHRVAGLHRRASRSHVRPGTRGDPGLWHVRFIVDVLQPC